MTADRKQERHNEFQREYYEARSSSENWRVAPVQTPYIMNHLNRFLEFAQLDPSERIIDVGCGMGKFTIPIAERGYDLEGLDLTPRLLEELTNNNTSGREIPVHCADLLELPEALLNTYDSVLGFFMLHHMVDLDRTFVSMYSLLKDEGRVLFLDVNPRCFLYYLQYTFTPSISWRAEKGMLKLTPKRLKSGLEKAGFTDVRIERYGIAPPIIRNRSFGKYVDRAFEALPFLKWMSAFQLISAQKTKD